MKGQENSRFGSFCRNFSFYFKVFKSFLTIPFQPKVQLRDPQQVLRSTLGDDLEVVSFSTDTLVKSGDNYGSSIVKATVDIKRGDDIEKLNLVAKMLPPSEFQRIVYQCNVTVAKEIFLYEELIPAYQKLYRGEFDIVPKFYGGRLAINADVNGIDDSAVILLENIKEVGYVMVDRHEGLDMNHMKIAIPAIAKFHAIGLAIKYKNPEFFAKIKDYAKPLDMSEEMVGSLVSSMLKMIKNHSQLSEYYERARSLNEPGDNKNCFLQMTYEPDDPRACVVHRDLWNNNVMFHIDNGKIDAFKFFDFQNYCFSSPMTDLFYFLLTSLQRDLKDLDEAFELYRICARDVLNELQCDASLFEKTNFDKQMKEDAASELFHSIIMAKTSEMRSMWDFFRPTNNPNFINRVRRILEIYDAKQWF
ncbi:uncharacterized protein LOC131666548 [Phymastichus coffea]|uniref:uncharacterized protein LOC131666548 n=1 Tax=Phymastichus coffea TaxID=108790 RepID=UPI00273ACCB2|nr:uncharacterized protein LOC131666548 [Phymastichus coffea]